MQVQAPRLIDADAHVYCRFGWAVKVLRVLVDTINSALNTYLVFAIHHLVSVVGPVERLCGSKVSHVAGWLDSLHLRSYFGHCWA